jgi:hypothetical protein
MCVSIRQCDCQRRQQQRKGAGYLTSYCKLLAIAMIRSIGGHFYTVVL